MEMPDPLWAYLVYQLTVDSGQLSLDANYIPQPAANSIIVSGDLHGKGTHTVEFEDGPVKTYADIVYLGEGERDAAGKITFGLGTQRLLNLIDIGLEAEIVLHNQVHAFAEEVQTKLEPILVGATRGQSGPDLVGDALRTIDEIEKHFWDRKH